MNIRTTLVSASVLLVLASGPAYPQNKDILQLQRDMIELNQRMKQIQTTLDTSNEVLTKLVERMADQVNNLSGAMQKVTQAVDSARATNDKTASDVRGALTNLNASVSELQKDLSSVRTQINSVSKEITSMKTTAEPLAGPDDIWRSAGLDFFTGNYSLAVSGYQEFLSKYPNDPRAAEGHLNMGDALAAQKKYEQAIFEYDIVLQKYSDSDKTRSALLKKGLAQAEQNQPQAIATLNEVVKKYPNTSEANSAQAKLKELRPAQRTPAR